MATRDRARRCAAEAVGTFILVAVGPGAVMVAGRTHAFGDAGIALAFGLAVMLCVAALGHVSGAHINPAVTIGFWSVRRFPAADVVPYVLAQCVGAVAASVMNGWLLGPIAAFGATTPALPLGRSFAVEAAWSALLGFVIMAVATDARTPRGVAPFAIGGTVAVGALVAGPLTGGSFNPARSMGPAIVGGVWTAHWLYWVAPIAGMIVAMRAYEMLRGGTEPPPPGLAIGVEGTIDDFLLRR
jgi:MIP family channel proteins